MKRLALTFLTAALVVLPMTAFAAQMSQHDNAYKSSSSSTQGVDIDAKLLTNAKVQSNGKDVGSVDKVMVNPRTGRIDHVDIKITQGQNRTISVPWSGVHAQKDNNGNLVLALNRSALESSPAASPKTESSTNNRNATNNYKK